MDALYKKAVRAALNGRQTYCKFLSANDTGQTKSHQDGFLLSKAAYPIFFDEPGVKGEIKKHWVSILWQDGRVTSSCCTYYGQLTRNEYRVTRFGRDFPFLGAEYSGALLVLVRFTEDDYEAYVLNTDDEIDGFLDAFHMSPSETNRLVETRDAAPETLERAAMERFIAALDSDFPETDVMSAAARAIEEEVYDHRERLCADPDRKLVDWTNVEYRLFRAIEQDRYGGKIAGGFASMDDFVDLANTVLNRRKSRAGKSLEHHLAALLDANHVGYTAQGRTEGNNKPDFILPSIDAYHDASFPVERLTFLSAKTTCKDRWRQILREADRLQGRDIYLCTLQQGNTVTQLAQMEKEHVTLVVPKAYINDYPPEWRSKIWTVKHFVEFVRELEA